VERRAVAGAGARQRRLEPGHEREPAGFGWCLALELGGGLQRVVGAEVVADEQPEDAPLGGAPGARRGGLPAGAQGGVQVGERRGQRRGPRVGVGAGRGGLDAPARGGRGWPPAGYTVFHRDSCSARTAGMELLRCGERKGAQHAPRLGRAATHSVPLPRRFELGEHLGAHRELDSLSGFREAPRRYRRLPPLMVCGPNAGRASLTEGCRPARSTCVPSTPTTPTRGGSSGRTSPSCKAGSAASIPRRRSSFEPPPPVASFWSHTTPTLPS